MPTSALKVNQLLAAVIGNALEWYDFVVFGFVSSIVAKLFFPASSEYAALLLTFATFGVGFFMRPVGAIVLGLYADRKGRKAALQMVIAIMTIAVALIAFAPTYASIGIFAPVLIVIARLLQGFATGGEFASATSYLVESTPIPLRGYFGSMQMVGQGAAAFGGSVAGALLTRMLTPEELNTWGWRVPFLIGLLIGPVGLYIRSCLDETEEFRSLDGIASVSHVAKSVLRDHTSGIVVAFLLAVCGTTMYYVTLVYMPTYAKSELGMALSDAFQVQWIAIAWMMLLLPGFGLLSDKLGRRNVMLGATLSYLVLPYPLMTWLHDAPGYDRLLVTQLLMCTVLASFFGGMSTAIAELFPTRLRSTGIGIAYNLAVMVFGGFAAFFITLLMKETGSALAPCYYNIFGALLGIVATLFLEFPQRALRLRPAG
ncbi:MAG: MFS transporter [Burkholderiaceae bacterium]|nr:MFS transporter [Burkholderiaceae bacterium]